MKTIIIENEIFKISDKEFKIIKEMEQKIIDSALDYKLCFKLDDDLHDYLEQNKSKYRHIGIVDFYDFYTIR